ncbi:MAG: hypothetical protein JXA54_04030 [Candidatus Heimdallarchaeota archaeon]|nr:hypothetical protein [Candidatus Heimdallarchaeota archaeon]
MFIEMTIQVLGTFLVLIGIIIFIFLILFSVMETDKDTKKMEPTKKDESQTTSDVKGRIIKVKTTGKHLNDLYLYTVYITGFSILAIFLMVSFFGFKNNFSLRDIWPFIFFVVVLIFFSLILIDRAKIKSKRTVQRDLREI